MSCSTLINLLIVLLVLCVPSCFVGSLASDGRSRT